MKTKKKGPEKLIYVIVPKVVHVDTVYHTAKLEMSCGRLMAQIAHAISKLKLRVKADPDEEYTTIILMVPDESKLVSRYIDLKDYIERYTSDIQVEMFKDTNPEFYGTAISFPTAMAAMMSRKQGKKHFYDLKLWECQAK